MSERWQILRGGSSEEDAESSDHPLDTDANGRSMQPGKPAVALITASGQIYAGKLHGSKYVHIVRWPDAGSSMAGGLYAELYVGSRLLRSCLRRDKLSHNRFGLLLVPLCMHCFHADPYTPPSHDRQGPTQHPQPLGRRHAEHTPVQAAA